jgi:putative flippase GtrA
MSLLREGRYFAMVGGVQWLTDWGMLVALSHFGVPIAAANIVGRVCGAVLGFWLNGSLTFAAAGEGPGWRQLGRYGVLWAGNTVLSTIALAAIDANAGLRGAWLAKPLVEGALALNTFLVSRWWVYR